MFNYIILLLILISFKSYSNDILDNVSDNGESVYIVRLNNGDIITGMIVEIFNDDKNGEGIKISTEVGKAIIYASQIADIRLKDDYFRSSHRIILQPTAEPINKDHFVGVYELLFFYAGFGLWDVFSMTLGHSMIPYIRSDQQISIINGKITLYSENFDSYPGSMSIALGGNLSFINHNNKLTHIFTSITFKGPKSIVSGNVFYKAGSEDFYTLRFGGENVNMTYENGSIGVGIGIVTRFSNWKDLHFVGELWNSNLLRPSNSAVLLGLRLANSSFSTDFGLVFFTKPLVAPFVTVNWTPFN